MEEKVMEVAGAIRPNVFSWISAVIGALAAWWTGLPVLAQALLVMQGADMVTGVMCAVAGRSRKTESGTLSSGPLVMGFAKKGLEWLVVGVCVYAGRALGFDGISGAAMTYMIATELVSLMENLDTFGLNIPLLKKILDVAQGGAKSEDTDE